MQIRSVLAAIALALPTPSVETSVEGGDRRQESSLPKARPEELGYSAERLAEAVETVSAWVEQGRIVGGELLVIAQGRAIVHEAFGWCDREREWPMKTDTVFRLQSMSKPVLATGILVLVEAGTLHLDTPVHEHLEEFDTEPLRAVTVRHLLEHTAGLDHADYNKSVWNGTFRSRREAIGSLAEHGPAYPPGERFVYANGNSDTLAELLERVTEMPAEQFLAERVLAPLGMEDSRFLAAPVEERGERYASAYVIRVDELVRYWDAGAAEPAPFFRGAGGLYGTADDFARFLRVWMDEGRLGAGQLLSRETVRTALAPTPASRTGGSGYGMSWHLFATPPADSLIFGHDGSDGTIAIAVPERGWIVAYFTQTRGTPTLVNAIELVLGALRETADAPRRDG